MNDLEIGVLDRIRHEFGGNLVDDRHALPVSADFSQNVGEHLAHFGLRIGGVGALRGVAQHAVRLLDDRQMTQRARFGRTQAFVLRLTVFVHEVEQQRHREALIGIVAQILQIHHHRAVEEFCPGGRKGLIEEAPLPAAQQRSDARAQRGGNIGRNALLIALLAHHARDAVIQIL